MNTSWGLINGEERHKDAPRTFHIPPLSVRLGLPPGKAVKIGMEERFKTRNKFSGEKFWVRILGPGLRLRYLGMVTNDLVFTKKHGLKDGDKIEFGAEHILLAEEPPRHARPPGLMSRREMDEFIGPDPTDN